MKQSNAKANHQIFCSFPFFIPLSFRINNKGSNAEYERVSPNAKTALLERKKKNAETTPTQQENIHDALLNTHNA